MKIHTITSILCIALTLAAVLVGAKRLDTLSEALETCHLEIQALKSQINMPAQAVATEMEDKAPVEQLYKYGDSMFTSAQIAKIAKISVTYNFKKSSCSKTDTAFCAALERIGFADKIKNQSLTLTDFIMADAIYSAKY